jgi:hypothetical protein
MARLIKVQDNKVLMYVRSQFGLSPILIVYLCHICVLAIALTRSDSILSFPLLLLDQVVFCPFQRAMERTKYYLVSSKSNGKDKILPSLARAMERTKKIPGLARAMEITKY